MHKRIGRSVGCLVFGAQSCPATGKWRPIPACQASPKLPDAITAEDWAATLGCYCGLLGLTECHRSDLGFPGAWLCADGNPQAVLHIVREK